MMTFAFNIIGIINNLGNTGHIRIEVEAQSISAGMAKALKIASGKNYFGRRVTDISLCD